MNELSTFFLTGAQTMGGELLLNVLIKVSVVLGTVGLVNALLQRSSASVRHWVWSLGFYGLVLMPLLSMIMPTRTIAWLPNISNEVVGQKRQLSSSPSAHRIPTPGPAALPIDKSIIQPGRQQTFLSPSKPVEEQQSIHWSVWALLLWVAGTLAILGRIALELIGLARTARRGKRIQETEWQATAEAWNKRLEIFRPVRLILSSEIRVPVTFGLLRPSVLLPNSARRWSAERREIVLMHELAHVKRHDYLPNLVAQVVCALYWFNPLVWLAARKLSVEREQACDDRVLREGAESCVYAKHLLEIAKSFTVSRRIPYRAVAMAHNSNLKQRLSHILSRKIRREQLPRRLGLISGVLVIAVLLPVAVVQLKERASSAAETALKNSRRLETLLADLNSNQPGVQKRAAWALGEREDSRAVESLIAALGDDNPDVRGMAAWALGEIKDKSALQPLLVLLSDDVSSVREMSARAVGELEDRGTVPKLTAMLEDPDSAVRAAALWALGEIGDRKSFYDVVKMLKDDRPEVRIATLTALYGIGCDPAFVAVTASLRDSDPGVREMAAKTLGLLVHKPTSKPLRSVVYEYSSGSYSRFLEVLPEFEYELTAVDYLLQALDDTFAGVRASAAQTLGRIGNVQAVDALIALLGDAAPGPRAMAVWALDEIDLP